MARHEVHMDMPRGLPVVNADVDFTVKSNGNKLGTLKLSKGAIEWLPANNHVTSFTLSWEQLSRVMEEQGRQRRRSQME